MRRWLWVAAACSLAASLTPWGRQLLYPFKLFTTWVHECGHAVMTLGVGGSVNAIRIEPDTSGVTESAIPAGHIAAGLVASAGYLGASIVGCVLMAATRVGRWARPMLLSVAAFMLLTSILWIRNLFGFIVVVAWAAALLVFARNRSGSVPQFVLNLLAIQVALASVYDIRALFLLQGGHSDARTMAMLFLLPPWVWAALWMLVSVAMLAWTVWATRIRGLSDRMGR
jgi:hypothetical protein